MPILRDSLVENLVMRAATKLPIILPMKAIAVITNPKNAASPNTLRFIRVPMEMKNIGTKNMYRLFVFSRTILTFICLADNGKPAANAPTIADNPIVAEI